MAITISCATSKVVTLDDYMEHVRAEVDLRDRESIAESALMLSALANDRELVVRQINRQINVNFRSAGVDSAQVIFLGRGDGFYVRANVWPSTADITTGRVYQDQFSYNVAHDHNYDFMTVSYLGPGYDTEVYEYDHEKVEGYIGEHVDFRFLERTHFASGKAMLYRASEDMHIQYPPDDLSITLNFMINTPTVRVRDQYFFDIAKRTIAEFPAELDGSRRIGVIKMAAFVGNDDTRQLLTDLANQHPCRRTRLSSFEALAKLTPERKEAIWERAAADDELLVSKAARARLKALTD